MKPFVLFSEFHGYVVLTGILLVVLTDWYARKVATPKTYARDVRIFAWTMAFIYVFLSVFKVIQNEWSLQSNLPFHLCDISAWTLVYALLKKNKIAFELGYFWGISGALLAFCLPTVTNIDWYIFPFFGWHVLLAAAPIYYIQTQKVHPTHRGLWMSVGLTIVTGLIMMLINYLLDSNYMFVSKKIEPMNYIGLPEYPLYLFILAPVMIALFYLFWTPFLYLSLKKNK
ncbi:MAG: TIGR02206 family membrane protein [Saprospiraceae bacterium]